jgi:putative FmdB family regulatory protein
MPIYEFECSGCGHRFDRLQKLSDTDPTVCPACDAPHLHRMLSAPSFRLAGSGWYETDFKKDGDKKRNLAGDAGGGAGDTKAAPADKPAVTAAAPAPAAAPAATVAPAAKPSTSSSSD